MDLSKVIGDLKLTDVAKAADIPIATLCRWRMNEKIPGRPAVQALRYKQVHDAVRKIKAEQAAA